MVNAELRMLRDADGTPVCNVSCDLSADQLSAAAHAVQAVRIGRHRGQDMGTDDVLALRELTGVADELHRLADHAAHGTLVLPLARFAVLHDALGEWVHGIEERGWRREADDEAFPVAEALLDPMGALRADALQAVLGAERAEHPER